MGNDPNKQPVDSKNIGHPEREPAAVLGVDEVFDESVEYPTVRHRSEIPEGAASAYEEILARDAGNFEALGAKVRDEIIVDDQPWIKRRVNLLPEEN